MVEATLLFALSVCVLVVLFLGIVYLIKWIGFAIPEQIMKLLWAILILIIVILAWRTFSPILGIRF